MKRGYDVVSVGSATVDVFCDTGKILKSKDKFLMLRHGDKVEIQQLHISTGGGGTNTAYNFSKLGLNAAFLGTLGEDLNGDLVQKALKDAKIAFLGKIKKGTTGYSVILDAKGHDRSILTYKGINNQLDFKDMQLNKIQGAKLIYFSSLLGKAYPAGQKLSEWAQQNNIPVAFNASSYLVAKGKTFLKKFLKNTNVFILNKEEAQTLLGKKVNDMKYLLYYTRSLLNNHSVAIITNGDEGAYLYDGRQYLHVQSRKVKVVESTGAGDAFASGFVTGLIKKKDLVTCLEMGQIEAEYNIQHFGAKCDLSYKQMQEQLKKPPKVIQL